MSGREHATQGTTALAESVAGLAFVDLPADVVQAAKNCVLDTFGVTIAGAGENAMRRLREATDVRGDGVASVLGTGLRTEPGTAALLNGAGAHVLDFDDLAMEAMSGHPSAPLLPAVLAVAETAGSTGAELITGFVAGYEAQARLGLALGAEHYRRGFHSTATIGVFGGAAGAGRLLRLTARQLAHAFGLAAAQSAGLKIMFGSMAKSFQVGRAASAGWLAARLAGGGFTSVPEPIDGPGGFARLYSSGGDLTHLETPFAGHWHILNNLHKEHASCFGTHATIDALLSLRDRLPHQDRIERIELRIPPGHLTVCAIAEPATGLEGKFSLAYTAALALVRGTADVGRFTDEAVASPELTSVARRVRLRPDDHTGPLATTVTVTTVDGERFESTSDSIAYGESFTPDENWERLAGKFHALADPVLGARRATELAAAIARLDTLADVRSLTALATPPAHED